MGNFRGNRFNFRDNKVKPRVHNGNTANPPGPAPVELPPEERRKVMIDRMTTHLIQTNNWFQPTVPMQQVKIMGPQLTDLPADFRGFSKLERAALDILIHLIPVPPLGAHLVFKPEEIEMYSRTAFSIAQVFFQVNEKTSQELVGQFRMEAVKRIDTFLEQESDIREKENAMVMREVSDSADDSSDDSTPVE